MQETTVQLEVQGLVVNFGGIRALNGVGFSVEKGEIFSIIGPNGAGKTTIFNCLNRIYHPQRGRILFEGKDLLRFKTHQVARLGLARTFQNLALFRHMTVLENILLGCHPLLRSGPITGGLFYGKALKEELHYRKRAETIIEFLEIEHIRKSIVGALPFGLQKRVELGRALALEPRLLLLDEPVSGMNVEETEDIARFVLDIREELGITILMVEHDMGVVMDISDRICAIHFGEKIAEGLPHKVREDPQVIKAYLGEKRTP